MTIAPATVASQLVDRLNELRIRPRSTWGGALDQVRFTLRGLKARDYEAYLAVSSMVSALECDPEAVCKIADEMESLGLHELVDSQNVLRSLSAVGCAERAESFALKMVEMPYAATVLNDLTDAVFCAGSLGGVERVAAAAKEFWRVEDEMVMDAALVDRIRQKASDEEFAAFHGNVVEVMGAAGWISPPMIYYSPMSCDGPDDCAAIARVIVRPNEDNSLCEIEDVLMGGMIAADDRLFRQGIITLGLSSAE